MSDLYEVLSRKKKVQTNQKKFLSRWIGGVLSLALADLAPLLGNAKPVWLRSGLVDLSPTPEPETNAKNIIAVDPESRYNASAANDSAVCRGRAKSRVCPSISQTCKEKVSSPLPKAIPRGVLFTQQNTYWVSMSNRAIKNAYAIEPISAFYFFLAANLVAALFSPIQDCDETFNYWEPTHYLSHGYGLQTWEYSPDYAIRSWLYIGFHAIVGNIRRLLPHSNKVCWCPLPFLVTGC